MAVVLEDPAPVDLRESAQTLDVQLLEGLVKLDEVGLDPSVRQLGQSFRLS